MTPALILSVQNLHKNSGLLSTKAKTVENILCKRILRMCFEISSNNELKREIVSIFWPSGSNSLVFLFIFPLFSSGLGC